MPTFDGENLVITLDLGVTEVDVEKDLYSEWKNWQLLNTGNTNNRKYPPAFRTIGGDELTLAIDAGAYFFIRNDLGWRVRPPEEDTTIYVIGNLTPNNALLPILVPTLGNFRVLVDGLQPITQSVDKILLQQQLAFYNGKVFIDFPRGGSGQIYPFGLASSPVNNSLDAHVLTHVYNLFEIHIKDGTFTVPHDMLSYKFVGSGILAGINHIGFDMSGSRFEGITFINDDFIDTPNVVFMKECFLSGITNFVGQVNQSGIAGTISLIGDSFTSFNYCNSNIPGEETPTIDAQNFGYIKLQFRGYYGGLKLINFTQSTNVVSLDLDSSHLILDDTITAGVIVIRGSGFITDNRTNKNATIVFDGFTEADSIRELHKHTGLDINDPTILTENNEFDVDMDNDDIRLRITKIGKVRTIQRVATP